MGDARESTSQVEGHRSSPRVMTEPIIQDITGDIDDGYDGDNENDQGLLPDSISEPGSPEDTEVETPEDKDIDFSSMPYDEAMLIKGFRKLETSGQSNRVNELPKRTKTRHTRKRSHSQMLSDSESEDDHYVVAQSRSSTPGGISSKRREIRRLRAVASFPTNHGRDEQADDDMQSRREDRIAGQESWERTLWTSTLCQVRYPNQKQDGHEVFDCLLEKSCLNILASRDQRIMWSWSTPTLHIGNTTGLLGVPVEVESKH